MYLTRAAELLTTSHHDGTSFEAVKESWRAAEAWHCGRTGEAIGEVQPKLAMEAPGSKRSCKDVETWHKEESPEEAIGESAAQLLQAFWKCQYHGATASSSSRYGLELA